MKYRIQVNTQDHKGNGTLFAECGPTDNLDLTLLTEQLFANAPNVKWVTYAIEQVQK
jgi:hypothetical protein